MVTIVMTAATPMTIPRVVRNDRMTFRRIARRERRIVFPEHDQFPPFRLSRETRPSRKWIVRFA